MGSGYHPPSHRAPEGDNRGQGVSNAVLSLILGLGGLILSVLLIGVFFAIPGLILAILHLKRYSYDRVLALWGLFVSAVGILLTVLLGVLYVQIYYLSTSELFGGSWESTLTPWQGVAAPSMAVTTRDGDEINLAELKGRRVIVHMWDPDCPSCDEEIAALNEIHTTQPADRVMVIGLSDGDASALEAYASETDAVFTLATADVLPPPFDDVSMPPVTFVIDQNGIIQHVLEENDGDAVTSLALGDAYEGEPKPAPQSQASTLTAPAEPQRLNPLWSIAAPGGVSLDAGDWDRDGVDEILVVDHDAALRVVSQSGDTVASLALDVSEAAQTTELGRGPDEENRILAYEIYGYIVDVFDASGHPLWQHQSDDEVNEAHWTDLDGDGIDELVAATDLGLFALTADGNVLWKVTRMGACWSQKAVGATGGVDARIVVLDENSEPALVDGGGNRLRFTAPTDRYLSDIAIMRTDMSGGLQVLLGGEGLTVAVDENGREVWRTPSDEDDFWRDTNYVRGRLDDDEAPEWVFVEDSGDLAVVSPRGEALARVPHQHRTLSFVVAESEGGAGKLVTLRSGVLRAYEMTQD